MVNYQVLKRQAVSQRVRELSCSQTNGQTDNKFYLRRFTGRGAGWGQSQSQTCCGGAPLEVVQKVVLTRVLVLCWVLVERPSGHLRVFKVSKCLVQWCSCNEHLKLTPSAFARGYDAPGAATPAEPSN